MQEPVKNSFDLAALITVHTHSLTDAMFMVDDCRTIHRNALEVTAAHLSHGSPCSQHVHTVHTEHVRGASAVCST